MGGGGFGLGGLGGLGVITFCRLRNLCLFLITR